LSGGFAALKKRFMGEGRAPSGCGVLCMNVGDVMRFSGGGQSSAGCCCGRWILRRTGDGWLDGRSGFMRTAAVEIIRCDGNGMRFACAQQFIGRERHGTLPFRQTGGKKDDFIPVYACFAEM